MCGDFKEYWIGKNRVNICLVSDNNKILWYGFYQTLWNAVSACLWHFRRFFFLSCRAKNRKMPEKRCQTWCLFMGCVSGILARIISLYSKKMQLVFKFQKAEYFVAVCFSSPARHKRANGPVTPLYRMALAKQVWVYRADSRQKCPNHGKRDVPNTLYWTIPRL